MLHIKIPAAAPIATAGAKGLKTTGPVAGPPILAFIDEALHQQNRMLPLLLPIGIESFEAQAKDPGRQVGICVAIRENQKTTVVHDKAQSPGSLARRPLDPLLPRLNVERWRAKGNQSDPLSVQFGDIAHTLPSESGAVQIVSVLQ
jgi:hypothetical protein